MAANPGKVIGVASFARATQEVQVMITLRELRRKSQIIPQEPDVSSRLIRQVSIYLTWLLVQTPITANQVTFLFLIIGLGGAVLLGLGEYHWTIIGVLFLQFHVLLDYSDGEVARYRGTTSRLGHFLDLNFHQVVHAAIFAGLSQTFFSHYWHAPVAFWLGASAITFAVMNRGLQAKVLRLQVEWGSTAMTAQYEDAAVSVRRAYRLLSLLEEIFFGYRGFIFVVLLVGALLRRLDFVLIFYGVTLPIYYVAKAVFVWRNLRASGPIITSQDTA